MTRRRTEAPLMNSPNSADVRQPWHVPSHRLTAPVQVESVPVSAFQKLKRVRTLRECRSDASVIPSIFIRIASKILKLKLERSKSNCKSPGQSGKRTIAIANTASLSYYVTQCVCQSTIGRVHFNSDPCNSTAINQGHTHEKIALVRVMKFVYNDFTSLPGYVYSLQFLAKV